MTVLEFSKICAVTLLPTASFKWCEKLWSSSVFLQETDCSNNAQLKTFFFSTKHNNTFYFYISAFSSGSQNNFDFYYHHHNTAKSCSLLLSTGWDTKMLCEQVVVTEHSCRIRSGIQEAWLTEPWKSRTSSLILHVFSLNQSHPPALSAVTNTPAPEQAQLALDTHLKTSTTHLPSLVHNHLLRTSLGQVTDPNSSTATCSKERDRTTSGLQTKMSCSTHQRGDQADGPAILVKLFHVQHHTKAVYLKRKPDWHHAEPVTGPCRMPPDQNGGTVKSFLQWCTDGTRQQGIRIYSPSRLPWR